MSYQLADIDLHPNESWIRFPEEHSWNKLFADFITVINVATHRLLNPKDKDLVLDVVVGAGEPRLTMGSMLRERKIVGTDLTKEMLERAHRNYHNGHLSNSEVGLWDINQLPLADTTADIINARFGFNFFPDIARTAHEVKRILRPGGRMATTLWSVPEKNFWTVALTGIIRRNLKFPPQTRSVAGTFHCAEDGLVSSLFVQAGIKNVTVKKMSKEMSCRTIDFYRCMMAEAVVPFIGVLGQCSGQVRENIKQEAYQVIHEKYPHKLRIDADALIIYGEK
jgi:ubiquinone/menaquinone biosynthesis C-methylase UbiE